MDSTRKQTEEALRESENYYRTLAQNLPQKIFLKDKNSVYLSCNENYSRDLKMRPAEIAGKTDYDFYPRELAEKYRADDKRIMESGKTEDIEEKYIQDGMEVIIHTVKTPIKDERGKAIGVLGIFWDITERKRADDELKKYRERLEELVEERTAELRNANEQLQQEIAERRRKEEEIQRKTVLLEAINNIFKAALSCRTSVEVARMCLNLAQELTSSKFGFIGEVNEAGCFDTIALSNPGWEKCKMPKADAVVMINNMEIRGIWGRVIKGRESLIVNQPSCHPDRVGVPEGHPPISAFLGIPLEHSGKTFGMIGLANRESGYSSVDQEMIEGLSGAFVEVLMRKRAEEELRKNEEKYRTILESMQDAYFEVDLAGKFTFVNDMVSRHLGYSRGELIGMNYRQYSDETTAKKLHRLYNKLYRTGEPIKGLDLEVIRKDGAKAFNEISASLVRDSEGRPIGFRGVFRDITERKKMEEALREREERYRTLLENMEEGYYEVDLKGRFTFFNDALRKMHGLPKEEMLGMNNRQYMEEAIAQKVYKIFNQVYKTGQPCKVFEWEIIRNDDKKAVVESSIYLVRNAKGEPVAFRGITRDITERKQAEEALRQSEEKYRTILENIEDGYYEVDLAGNFTFFNDSICRILGYSKEELTGMNNRQYTEPENATKVFQAFNRVFRTGERSREFDWEIIRKDGTKRYIEASVSLRKDASGKPVGFRGIVRDITERKQMGEALHEREEQYRTLLETMAEGYYEVDLHGRFTFFNDALREMHGLPKEEMLGMSNRKYMDEETAEKVYKIFNQVYKTGQACKLSQWEIIRRDGKKAVVESPVYLIKNAKGEPVGFRGITHDITERKHAEEALRQSEEKYRNILENIEDGYYEVDLAGNFTFFNDSMCRILGYPKEELMGMNNRQYSDQENAKRVYQAFNRVYRTGEPGRVFH